MCSLGGLLLGAGCASSQEPANEEDPGLARDSVIHPEPTPDSSLIAVDHLELTNGARLEEITVGQMGLLQAENATQFERARELLQSGAYLGDPVQIVLLDEDSSAASYTPGRSVDAAFESEILFRIEEGGTISFVVAGTPVQAGRRMPSMLRVDVRLDSDGGEVVTFVGDAGRGDPSELTRAQLTDVSFEFAHRLGITYSPGTLSVQLDGRIVAEATARIAGSDAVATLESHGTALVQILSWKFQQN
ncbi:MAG: hypothetical protein R3284_01975 [Rubricoccaceae bacterium]|nr:hypothetical protein [Rubricoccaceae bacterium]